MSNDLSVSPPVYQMGSRETRPLQFDATLALVQGTLPTSPGSALTDLQTQQPYSAGLQGSPTFQGNTIVQTVTGLQVGHRYRLDIWFTAAPGDVRQATLEIDCQ